MIKKEEASRRQLAKQQKLDELFEKKKAVIADASEKEFLAHRALAEKSINVEQSRLKLQGLQTLMEMLSKPSVEEEDSSEDEDVKISAKRARKQQLKAAREQYRLLVMGEVSAAISEEPASKKARTTPPSAEYARRNVEDIRIDAKRENELQKSMRLDEEDSLDPEELSNEEDSLVCDTTPTSLAVCDKPVVVAVNSSIVSASSTTNTVVQEAALTVLATAAVTDSPPQLLSDACVKTAADLKKVLATIDSNLPPAFVTHRPRKKGVRGREYSVYGFGKRATKPKDVFSP